MTASGGARQRHFTVTGFLSQAGRTALHWHRLGMWLPPGGHVEPNEDPVQAVLREVEEETGIRAKIVAGARPFHYKEPQSLPPPVTLGVYDIPGDPALAAPHQHIDLIYFTHPLPGEHLELPPLRGWAWVDEQTLRESPVLTYEGREARIPEDVRELALASIETTRDLPAPRRLVIEDYNPGWPAEFERARADIEEACGDLLVGIEHVGSTAIPGMPAKPIIDVMPVLRRYADGFDCVAPLRRLGYEYRGEYGMRGRHYFVRYAEEDWSTHHVHMQVLGDRDYEERLLFRDYLRGHRDVADEYAALKRRLAEEYRFDREGYTEAKTPFVRRVLQLARAERGTGGERVPPPVQTEAR